MSNDNNLFIPASQFDGRLNLDNVSGVENDISKGDFEAIYCSGKHEVFDAASIVKFASSIASASIVKSEDGETTEVSGEVIDIVKSEMTGMKSYNVIDNSGEESIEKKFWVRELPA